MSHYGTGVVQGVEPFHMKHSTRHHAPARTQATQTYNPIRLGKRSVSRIHLVDFHNFFSSHTLCLFPSHDNTGGVQMQITADARKMPISEELGDMKEQPIQLINIRFSIEIDRTVTEPSRTPSSM